MRPLLAVLVAMARAHAGEPAALEPVRWLPGHAIPPTVWAVAPDGAWVATASLDGSVRLRSLADGAERVLALEPHSDEHLALAASPDGTAVAALGRGVLRCWSAADGGERWRVEAPRQYVSGLIFSGDGKRLLGAVHDRERPLICWSAADGAEQARPLAAGAEGVAAGQDKAKPKPPPRPGPPARPGASPPAAAAVPTWEARTLALLPWDGGDRVRTLQPTQAVVEWDLKAGAAISARLALPGLLASRRVGTRTLLLHDPGPGSRTLRILDDAGAAVSQLDRPKRTGAGAVCRGGAIAPDGARCWVGWGDATTGAGSIAAYELGRGADTAGKQLWSREMPVGVPRLALAGMTMLLALDIQGTLWRLDAATGEPLPAGPLALATHAKRIDAMAISPDGTALATGAKHNELLLRDLATGHVRWRVGANLHAWHGDVVLASREERLQWISAKDGTLAAETSCGGYVSWARVLADGGVIAYVGTKPPSLVQVDAPGAPARRLRDAPVANGHGCTVLPDGSPLWFDGRTDLAVGGRDGAERARWRVDPARPELGWPTVLAISGDGSRCAHAGHVAVHLRGCDGAPGPKLDLTQVVGDASTFQPLSCAAFVRGGALMATGMAHGPGVNDGRPTPTAHEPLSVWDASTGREIARSAGLRRAVVALAEAPDGTLWTAHADGGVAQWKLP